MAELIASAMTDAELNVGITTEMSLLHREQRGAMGSLCMAERSKNLFHLPSIAPVSKGVERTLPTCRAHPLPQRRRSSQLVQAPCECPGR